MVFLVLALTSFALSVLAVTTDKNSALQGTFSAATKSVQVSVRTMHIQLFASCEENDFVML
jgi:hypothetical protein